ncbi:MAG TPA: hypothetical protein VLZ09_06490 [Gaiellaceae bacterium]|nr:hypothetical protein [Gaiellaceae bacterium]
MAEVSSHYEVETQTGAVDFTCECGLVDCAETMLMTIAEYEAIRAHATHFGVVPQHEQPEIETVIERHPSCFVVRSASRTLRKLRARQTRARSRSDKTRTGLLDAVRSARYLRI